MNQASKGPLYPQVKVLLIETTPTDDLLALVRKAMIKQGVSKGAVQAFEAEAASQDWEHLVATINEYVDATWTSEPLEDEDEVEEPIEDELVEDPLEDVDDDGDVDEDIEWEDDEDEDSEGEE